MSFEKSSFLTSDEIVFGDADGDVIFLQAG